MSTDALNQIRDAAIELAWRAKQAGVVVTIHTEPRQPPAMGNYYMSVDVRPARHAPQTPPSEAQVSRIGVDMTIDEAIAFADEWSSGMTFFAGSMGWRVVCRLLADEVRRLRVRQPEPPLDTRAIREGLRANALRLMVEKKHNDGSACTAPTDFTLTHNIVAPTGPDYPESEAALRSTEALRDMLESARADIEVIREALGVPIEPHQSLMERMVEAAGAKVVKPDVSPKTVPQTMFVGAQQQLVSDLREYLYRVSGQLPFEAAQWANERGSALLDAVRGIAAERDALKHDVERLMQETKALKYSLQLDEELIGKIQQIISVLANRPEVSVAPQHVSKAEKCDECRVITARLDGDRNAKYCCHCGAKLTGNYVSAPQPVGVSTSSFPDRDLTKPAEQQGLFHKFDVRRVDGSSLPGGKHHGCEYFVLDLHHDEHAPAALRAYALSCSASHPQLSADLLARYPTVGEVKDTAPEMVKGGRYNWKDQKERLVYLGRNRSGNGFWHQFAKIEAPTVVWCEVVDADLHMIEKTTQPVGEVPMPDDDDVVGYVARYGGTCRDCADENGVCPSSGLPCGGARKAIEHVIKALQYGVQHGYIASPIGDAREAAGYAAGVAATNRILRRMEWDTWLPDQRELQATLEKPGGGNVSVD